MMRGRILAFALQPLVDPLAQQPGGLPGREPGAALDAAKLVRAHGEAVPRMERLPSLMAGALQAGLERVQ